jgi:hypothetical protein
MEMLVVVDQEAVESSIKVVVDLLKVHLVDRIIQPPHHLVGVILDRVDRVETLGQVVEEEVLVVLALTPQVKVLAVLVDRD